MGEAAGGQGAPPALTPTLTRRLRPARSPAESAFADTLPPARLSQARFSACPPPGSLDAANFDNNELEHNQVVAKLGHLVLGRAPGPPPADAPAAVPCAPRERPRPASSPALLEADLRFHVTRGPDVSLSTDRKVACAPRPDGGRTLVFSERPLRPGESLFVEVGRPGLPAPGALAFGITSCDPGGLRPAELPADPDALLDRKEYWVVARAGPVPSGGDALSFSLRPGGDVYLGVNGRPRGRLLCVDTTQALWAFFAVRGGAAGQLRLLGEYPDCACAGPPGRQRALRGSCSGRRSPAGGSQTRARRNRPPSPRGSDSVGLGPGMLSLQRVPQGCPGCSSLDHTLSTPI